MQWHRLPWLLVIVCFLCSGCSRPLTDARERAAGGYLSVPGAVGFDIVSLADKNGSLRIDAAYRAGRSVAKFGVEFGPTQASITQDLGEFPIGTGEGRFTAEPGSDPSVLLADLRTALEAQTMPVNIQRVQTLPFTFVKIGDKFLQAPDGGFNAVPLGGWTVVKLFIGRGRQEGDVFLNFNTDIKKGQFSIKDPDDGDNVLRQLARVL